MIPRREFLLGGLALSGSVGVANGLSIAPQLVFTGTRKQGSLMIGRLATSAEVLLENRPLSVSPDGYFVFGLEYNQTAPAHLSVISGQSGQRSVYDILPIARTYEVQRIDGLPEQQAHPSEPAIVARIVHENATIASARTRDTAGIGFTLPFDWPVPGIVSSRFGSQRILNGVPAAPHFGIDIAAPEGTPIRAPADGTVTLAEPDYYLTGGTTVLDHGHGVYTMYIHQNALKVVVGQVVKRAEMIGLVGKKGRATGPHLHWGLNWFQMKLDPSLSTGTPLPPKA